MRMMPLLLALISGACAGPSPARQPDLAGAVVLTFRIEGDGRVTDARTLQSSVAAPDVSACLVDVVAGLVFPASRDGIHTTVRRFPFVFRPR